MRKNRHSRGGKALQYFSRHYGKVFKADGETLSVKEALVGINQILDEDTTRAQNLPPVIAEPITRQFLRIFDGKREVARDQMQKILRGSGITPDEFEQRNWCFEKNKVFKLVEPFDFACEWRGRHKRRLTSDLDQALVLIGACFDGSGMNVAEMLRNENFKPRPALKALLEWLSKRSLEKQVCDAALRALAIYNSWTSAHPERQMALFFDVVTP